MMLRFLSLRGLPAEKYGAATAALKLAALRFVKENTTAVVGTAAWRRVPPKVLNEALVFNQTGKLPEAVGGEEVAAGGEGGGGDDVDQAAAGGGSGRNVRQRTA